MSSLQSQLRLTPVDSGVSGDPSGLREGGYPGALASLSQWGAGNHAGSASFDPWRRLPAGDCGLSTEHLLCADTPPDLGMQAGTSPLGPASRRFVSQAPSCLCTSPRFAKHVLCAQSGHTRDGAESEAVCMCVCVRVCVRVCVSVPAWQSCRKTLEKPK